MTPESRPAAVPFHPGSGELPPALEPVFNDPDGPILLLVAAEADDPAARTAIGLAEIRASRGIPTVLADADLDAPRLHGLLDVPNLEGLVDVFLFGASLERVSVRPKTRGFDFAPAGAYAPDPAEVLQSPRWDRIAEELTEENALLLVFLPAAAAGARALSRRVGRAIILGDDRAVERAAARLDPSCQVLAAVRPPPTVVSAEEPTAGAAPVRRGAASREPDLTEPVVIRAVRKERTLTPFLLLILAFGMGAAAWLGYQELFLRDGSTAAAAPVSVGPEPRAEGPLVETAIPFSVAVEAHQDLASAMQRVRLLSRAEPDIGFHLAPVSVRGVLYYRLLAGPLPDRETGLRVMQRLVDGGHKTGMDEWAVRPTTLAFHLGDYETRGEAESRSQTLAAAGIPTYVVPQRYESGAFRYRVFGGAYESQGEAEVMREILENAGEPARLIPRVGEPGA